jgi:hypothetical protein
VTLPNRKDDLPLPASPSPSPKTLSTPAVSSAASLPPLSPSSPAQDTSPTNQNPNFRSRQKRTTYLILSSTEQIRMPRTDRQSSDGRDVAGKRDLKLSRCEVPDFDDTVASPGSEPLIPRLDGHSSDPAEVSGDDAGELP